ncbi:glycosyltransferase family 87 protein [Polluticoccus soli]|uniref:glycosyltransferase family 87 protein n=1 Tax=Polluticoccus soli TaxID=3034150 RepID=UPI0023E2C3B2|nr:glycosyltransferase family 87 protein [Flavipsychrobacter sp. JY13-12]
MNKWQTVKGYLLQHRVILFIYVAVTVIASVHLYSLGNSHEFAGRLYTEYNNYVIFKQSFFHLLNGKDLYAWHLDDQWDLFKYSPAFALCMGLLAWMPDVIGLVFWNLANALAVYVTIRMLPFDKKKTSLLLWFILLELLTSLQSAQSNGLMAACMIGAVALMERRKPFWATFLIMAATFIKVYGIIGLAIFLFYPDKIKFILYTAFWTVVMFFIPLVVLTPAGLMVQYQSWVDMMAHDQSVSYGFSVMGWLHSWFGLSGAKNVVTLLGIFLFFLPLVRVKQYGNQVFRLLFLAFMLIWVIIFNHKAESSTFIIAVSGVGIWYFAGEPVTWKKVLLWVVFIFTCLSPTDLFPAPVRQNILVPYVAKVVPCIAVWLLVCYELMTMKRTTHVTHQ